MPLFVFAYRFQQDAPPGYPSRSLNRDCKEGIYSLILKGGTQDYVDVSTNAAFQ